MSSKRINKSNVVVGGLGGVELSQQVDDHFKKSIEHIHSSSSAIVGSPNSTGGFYALAGSGSTWRDKQTRLPKSFFEPAANSGRSQNHSRDNSTDSSGRYTQSPPVSVVGVGVAHNRAHSSPAMLTPAQLSLPPTAVGSKRSTAGFAPGIAAARHASATGPGALPPLATPPHQRFASFDAAAAPAADFGEMPHLSTAAQLPDGWQRAFDAETGQYVYMNFNEKRPKLVVEDGRKCASSGHLHHAVAPATAVATQALGPLPPGWDEAYTNDGHKYFINHNEQRTTWYDPRLPEEVQRPTILQQRQMQQQLNVANAMQNKCSLLVGQQMIVHQSSASAPSHCFNATSSRSVTGSAKLGLPSAVNVYSGSSASYPINSGTFSPNSQKRVQDLSRECASYRLRQEEIMKQGLLMDCSLSPNPISPGHNPSVESCVPYAAMCAGGNQLSSSTELHLRQESSDSGVGLGGPAAAVYTTSAYSSMPHTPENFLSSPPAQQLHQRDLTALNIAGIDLNFSDALPMDMDTSEDMPQLNPNELDQILNYRPSVRH